MWTFCDSDFVIWIVDFIVDFIIAIELKYQ